MGLKNQLSVNYNNFNFCSYIMYKFKHFQLNNSIHIDILIQLLGVDFETFVHFRDPWKPWIQSR